MLAEDIIKDFFKSFNVYIAKCKKQCQILWDSVASEDLMKPHARSLNFISQFQSMDEFKRLIDIILSFDEEYDEDDYRTRLEYRSDAAHNLHNFFTNTGIYDFIIAGKEVDSKTYFGLFITELLKGYYEMLEYGEIYPLALDIESDALQFDNFKISRYGDGDDIDIGTNYCFIINAKTKCHLMRHAYPIPDTIPGVKRATPFSLPVLLLNLYFEKPVYIREWWEKDQSHFGHYYKPKRTYIDIGNSAWEDIWHELETRYRDEALNHAYEDGSTNWDEYGDFIQSKEKDLIESGNAPICYLREKEIPRFRDFIIEASNFLNSDFYKKQTYLHIAIHYYLMAHERENARDDIINYVTALESLYFTSDEHSKITEQFPIKIANLLGKDSEENKFIHDNMSFIYKKRCDYVHGSELLINPKREWTDYLRNTLRLSLLYFFILSKRYDSKNKRVKLLAKEIFDEHIIADIRANANTSTSRFLSRPYNFNTAKLKE